MDLAFSAGDAHVPADRWIASLSDGRTVFQDVTPRKTSAWRRLQKLIQETDTTLTGLRLQAGGRMVTMPPAKEVDGYWWASRLQAAVGHGVNQQRWSQGVGYIKDGMIHITWVNPDGVAESEERPYDPAKDLAGILHEH